MRNKLPVGVLKYTPNCFVVQELVRKNYDVQVIPLCETTRVLGREGNAPVTLFNLTKVGYTTRQAAEEIARQFNITEHAISSYGLKDRHARTSQRIGVEGWFEPRFRHDSMWLQQMGFNGHPLTPGGNKGNRFGIEIITEARNIDASALATFPNHFGTQRIGTRESCEVGRLLFEGDFDKAAELFFTHSTYPHRLVQLYNQAESWKEAWFHPSFRFDFRFNLLKWQSWLWNELVRQLAGAKLPERVPMWNPNDAALYEHLWNPPHVDEDALERMQNFTRATEVEARNLSSEKTLLGWRFKFDLPSGAYATVALSQVFDLKEI